MNYRIKYEIVLHSSTLKNKECVIHNADNELIAKIKLEKVLEKKYKDFKRLIVLSCENDFMSSFGDILGTKFW